MDIDARDLDLIGAIGSGLPLSLRPFLDLGLMIGMDEDEVIRRLEHLRHGGVIRRFGVIVRHHELGYRANAMVVWDIPDDQVSQIGRRLGEAAGVTLCYRRPRRLPDWPYNLFTMIHGRDQAHVLQVIARVAEEQGVDHFPRSVLFSTRRFKQCGARYGRLAQAAE